MMAASYKRYMLGLLSVILLFNYVDRLALGILLQDIKLELHLTDTQLGLMSGLAFAVFYSVMGIPIARWADRGNRVTIIALTTALWSFAVASCGLAGGVVQLILIRIGVGVGEAGCVPPALSLISTHFDRAERPKAVGLYYMGGILSFVVGLLFAGWLNEFFGWRVTFMLLGAPGLVLATLAWFTLREPRTPEHLSIPSRSMQAQPSITEVCTTLWGNTTFRHLLLCQSVLYFFNYGVTQWQPAFFMRSYGLTSGQIGTWMAVMQGLGGVLGTYFGGVWASQYAAGNEALQLRVIGVAMGSCAVMWAIIFLSHDEYLTWALLGLTSFALYGTSGPFMATTQTLVPERMRAMSIAFLFLFANLIGMGLGPLATGALSDSYQAWAGDESLRFALLTLTPGYVWVGWHAWRAGQSVTCDLAALSPAPREVGAFDDRGQLESRSAEDRGSVGTLRPTANTE